MPDFSTDAFLMSMYEKTLPKVSLTDCPDGQLESMLAERRELLRRIMRIDALEACELFEAPQLLEQSDGGGYRMEKFSAEIADKLFQPYYKLTPAAPNGRVVIYHCGHSGDGVRGCVDPRSESGAYQRLLPVELARRGYTVYAHEPFGFGEMTYNAYSGPDKRGCFANTGILQLLGVSTTAMRVFQMQKIMDIAEKENKTDRFIIGGISGGGLACAFTGAVDRRVGAAFVQGYTNTYRDSIMRLEHCIDNYMPGTLLAGESADVLALHAPHPLLVSNGDADPIFPLAGTKTAVDHLRKVYGKLGRGEVLSVDIFPGEHVSNNEAVFGWLEKLKF